MLPITTTQDIRGEIATSGYSIVHAEQLPLTPPLQFAWHDLQQDYEDLPPDNHLPQNGKYRFRRYDRFYFFPVTGALHLLPHEDYFQDTDINAVTGGIVRRFAPLKPQTVHNPFLHALIRFDFEQFPLADEAMRFHPWQVDVHEMLVVAQPGQVGLPTPEGVHRDGAEFVTVHIAVLENADGATVTVYDDDKKPLQSFQLQHVLDSYLFNDEQLWHGVTPLQSRDGSNPARRGILTFDFHYAPDLIHKG